LSHQTKFGKFANGGVKNWHFLFPEGSGLFELDYTPHNSARAAQNEKQVTQNRSTKSCTVNRKILGSHQPFLHLKCIVFLKDTSQVLQI